MFRLLPKETTKTESFRQPRTTGLPECPSEAKSLLKVVANQSTTKTMPVEYNYKVHCTQMLPYEHRHEGSTHHDSS